MKQSSDLGGQGPDSNGPQPPGMSASRAGTVVGCLYGLVALASSAVATVLPSIRRDFDIDVAASSWVVTVFVLGLAASTAIYGRAADVHGTARPLVIGTLAMVAGAALAASAPNLGVLLAGRSLQGVGAGAIPALAGALVADRFAGHARTTALGRVSALAAAAAAGVLVGGLADRLLSWRFAVAIPVLGVLLLPAAARLTHSHPAKGRIDVIGAVLVAAFAVGTTLALSTPRYGWQVGGPALAVVGVSIGLLARRAATRPSGFVGPAELRNRPLVVSAVSAATMPAAYFAGLILIPAQLDQRYGLSPVGIGLVLLPAAICGALTSRLLPRLRRGATPARVATVGLLATATGLAVAVAPTGTPATATLGFAAIAGGYALGQANLLEIAAGALPTDHRASGLGLWNLVFFLGGSLGGSVTAALTPSLGAPTTGWIVAALPLIAAGMAARSPSLRADPKREPPPTTKPPDPLAEQSR